MHRKITTAMATTVCLALLLSACGSSTSQSVSQLEETQSQVSQSSEETSRPEQTQDDGDYMRVSAIEGDVLTLETGTYNIGGRGGSGGSGGRGDGSTPSENQGEKPTTPPEGTADENAPEMPEGEQPSKEKPADMGEMETFTADGNTTTITVTNSTAITIRTQDGETAASLSEIAVGDILRVSEFDGAITIVIIRGMQAPSDAPQGEQPQETAASESVAG